MRGVDNDAAKIIVDSLKSMLSVERVVVNGKKWASVLWWATVRAFVKKSARFFLPGTKRTRNWP